MRSWEESLCILVLDFDAFGVSDLGLIHASLLLEVSDVVCNQQEIGVHFLREDMCI